MKIYRLWLSITLSTIIFLGILGNLSGKSAFEINNELTYINGYFNFAFNGAVRMITGKNKEHSLGTEDLANQFEKDLKQSFPTSGNLPKQRLPKPRPSIKYTTYDKKVETGLNQTLKKVFGFDLNGIIHKVKTLPLEAP